MAFARRGRPRCEAVIDRTEDKARFYCDLFYEACAALSYSDCKALSHGLDVSLRCVYAWRNRRTFPRSIGTALQVVDWVAADKPTRLVSQREVYDRLGCV